MLAQQAEATVYTITTNAGAAGTNIFTASSGDTVIFDMAHNSSSWFGDGGICVADIVLTGEDEAAADDDINGYGMYTDNGYGNSNYIFAGSVSGSGDITNNWGNDWNGYYFSGNLSNWSGNLITDSDSEAIYQFGNYDDVITRPGTDNTSLGSFSDAQGNEAVSGRGYISMIGDYDQTDSHPTGNYSLTYYYGVDQTAYISNTYIENTSTEGSMVLKGGAAYFLKSDVTIAGVIVIQDNSSVTIIEDDLGNHTVTTNNLTLGTAADGDTSATSAFLTVASGQTLTISGAVTSYGESSLTNSGTLNLAAGVTLTADSSLDVTLGGLVSVVEAGQIVVNDLNYFTLDSDVIFDLSEVTFTASGDDFVFQLITTGEDVDLSDIFEGFGENNVTGLASGIDIIFGDDGTISYTLGQVLSYTAGGDFVWTTTGDEGSDAFINSDGGTQEYTSGAVLTVSGNPAHATLGSDVDPKQLIIDGVEFTLTGGEFKMNSDQVSFTGAAILTLTDDALGADAVIGTGHNTAATVKFAATEDATTFNYSDQMNGFAGNVVVNNGVVTIGASEGGNSTLAFNTVTVNGGSLNLGLALDTTNITVGNSGSVADFNGAVTTDALTLSDGTTTFNQELTVEGAMIASGGTVNLNGVTTASTFELSNSSIVTISADGSLTVAGAFTTTGGTVNGDFSAASVSVTGATTFDGAITSTGALGLTALATFSTGASSFSSLSRTSNSAAISLTNGASLEFTSTSTNAAGTNISLSLAADTSITFNSLIGIYGNSTWTINGDTNNGAGGTIYFDAGLSIGYTYSYTRTGNMTIGQYASVVVEDSLSFGSGTYGGNLTVNGNFTSSAAIAVDGSSTSTITVGSTGVLTLGEGLTVTQTSGSTGTLNLGVTGTLVLGTQDDTSIDYSSVVTTTMNSGSILKAGDAVTNVATSLTYADNASITFDGNGNSLVMQSAINVDTLVATIVGNVTFAGATNLASVTVAEDANLSISNKYTFGSVIDNSGTVTILEGASFDISAFTLGSESGVEYSLTLIDCGENGTVDMGTLSYTDIFSEEELTGFTDISFVNGVLYYTVSTDVIIWSTGETLNLGTDQTIGGIEYTDSVPVVLNGADVAVTLTTDVAAESLTISGGIIVTMDADGESKLNSGNVIVGGASILSIQGDILGASASFANSIAGATIEFVLADNETVTYQTQMTGFTGNLVISGDGVYSVTSGAEEIQNFTSLTVNAGATYMIGGASWNIDGTSVTLVGGDEIGSAATFSASDSSIGADFSISGYTVLDATTNNFYLVGDLVNTGGATDTLVKTGAGDLSFYGDVNYTGDLDIQSGGVFFAGSVSGTFGDITMAASTTLSLASAASVTSISVAGDATLVAGGVLTIGSGYTVSAGTYSLSADSLMDVTSIDNVALGGATLSVNSGTVTLGAVSTDASGPTITQAAGTKVIYNASNTIAELGSAVVNIELAANTTVTVKNGAQTTTSTKADRLSDSSDINIVVNTGSTYSDNVRWWTKGIAFDISGGGTVQLTSLLLDCSGSSSTLTLGVGTTLEILSSGGSSSTGFGIGGATSADSEAHIYGTMIINGNIWSDATSNTQDITIYSGGTMQFNDGLNITTDESSQSNIVLDFQSNSTLALGDQGSGVDDSDIIKVTMASNSTVKAVEETSNVNTTLGYADNATVNFKADTVTDTDAEESTQYTLKMNSEVTGTNISANIVGTGNVEFAGGATLTAAIVEEGATFTLSTTAASIGTTTVEGAMVIADGVTLTGGVTLDGGSLDVAGTLSNALTVTANDGALSSSSESGLTLASTITLADGSSLNLSDESSVSLGEDFRLVLDSWTFDADTTYDIFTDLGADIYTDNANWEVTGDSIAGYNAVWYYDEESDKLTLSFEAALTDIIWDSTTGSIINGNDTSYATATIVIDTTSYDSATLNADDGATIANLTISGDNALTINGGTESDTLVVTGTMNVGNAVTIEAAVDAGTLTGAGSLIVTTDGSLDLADASTYTGSLSVTGGTVTFAAAAEETTVNLSNLTLTSGSLTVGDNVSITESSETTHAVDVNDFDLDLGQGSSIVTAAQLYFKSGASFDLTGSGTYEVSSILLSCATSDNSSLTIGSGSTLHITGSNDTTSSSVVDYAFVLGNFAAAGNTVTVNGTLIVDAALSAKNGAATITVNSEGVLQLNSGLDFVHVGDSTAKTSSLVVDGGTLKLGAGTATTDYSYFTVTVNDGSTIAATAVDGDVVNVYENITYAGTVTFDGSLSTLTMNSAVSNSSASASIEGNVVFAGGTSLSAVTMTDGSSLTLAGTGNSLTSLNFADTYTTTFILADEAEVTVDGGATSGSSSVTQTMESGTINLVVGDDAVYSDSTLISTKNADINISGGGTVELTSLLLANTTNTLSTLTIAEDTTLHITGTGNSATSGLTVGNSDAAQAEVNISGELIVDGTLRTSIGYSSSVAGTAVINVLENGTLTLNSGFTTNAVYYSSSRDYRLVVNVEDGATVAVGNQSNTTDYGSTELKLTMEDGSTLTTNAVGADVTVYTTLVYDDNATVEFDSNGGTLTMATEVSGTSVSADITGGGTVAFTGGATLSTLDVDSSTSFVVSGTESAESAVTAAYLTSTDATAAVTVGSYGSLTMTDADGYTGTLTLAGGALTVANSGTLSTAISVTAANSSLSAATLNSTISLGTGISLALGGDVTFGTDFSIDLGVDSWTIGDRYTIFTDAGTTDVSGLDISDIVGAVASEDYTYTWTNTDGTITLEVLTAIIAGDIVYSAGDTLDLGVDEVVGGVTYTDACNVTINTADATLNMTSDIAPASLTIGTADAETGITVTLAASDYTLNSSNIIINANSTLVISGNELGTGVSFKNSSDSSTIEINASGTTLTYTDELNGYTGNVSLTAGTLTLGETGDTDTLSLSSLNVGYGTTATVNNAITSSGDITADGVATFNASISTDGTLYVRNGNARTFNGTVAAAEIWTTNGTNNYEKTVAVAGQIYLNGGTSNFKDSVTAGRVYIANGSTATFTKDVTATANSDVTDATGDIELNNCTVTFDGAVTAETVTVTSATGTKTFNSDLDATTLHVDASATVNLNGTTTLDSLSLTAAGTVNLTGAVTVSDTTTVSAGSLVITGEGSLSGDITLAGGSLTVDSTLSNNLKVTTAGSSLNASSLNSTITLSDGVSLALSNVSSLGTSFELDLTAWDLVKTGVYEIFTGLSSDITTENWAVTGDSIEGYIAVWTYEEDGSLTLSYEIDNTSIIYSDGGTLNLGIDEVVGEYTYTTDECTVTIKTDSATLNMTSDIAPISLTIGDAAGEAGITVTLAESDFTLNSSDIIINANSTLVVSGDELGTAVSFANSSADSTIEVDAEGSTLSYTNTLDGYTGNVQLTDGDLTIGESGDTDTTLEFASLTVGADADGFTLNVAYDGGDITLNSDATFNSTLNATSLSVSAGTVTLNDTTTLGALSVSGGTLNLTSATTVTGTTTVSAGSTLNISGGYTFNSAIDNDGTVNILAGALLDITNLTAVAGDNDTYSYTLISGGDMSVYEYTELSDLFTDDSWALLTDATDISFSDGILSYTIEAVVTDVMWDSTSGSIINGSDEQPYSDASIVIDTTDYAGATLNADDGATIANLSISGTNALTIDSGDDANTLTVTGTLDISNDVTMSSAVDAGTITLGDSASLTVGSTVTAGTLTSAGDLTVTTGSELTVAGAMSSTGTISNAGSLTIGDGSAIASVVMVDGGTLTVSEGTEDSYTTVKIDSLTGTGTLYALDYTDVTIDDWESSVAITVSDLATVLITSFATDESGEDTGTLKVEDGKVTIADAENLNSLTLGETATVVINGDVVLDVLDNTGTMEVTGSLTLTGSVSNGGTVTSDSLVVATASFNDVKTNALTLTSLTNLDTASSDADEPMAIATIAADDSATDTAVTTTNSYVMSASSIAAVSDGASTIALTLSQLTADTEAGNYYLIENTGTGDGYTWDMFTLDTSNTEAIASLVSDAGMDVVLGQTESGSLVLIVDDTSSRTWNLSENFAVTPGVEDSSTNTITPIFEDGQDAGVKNLVSYTILSTVDRVVIDESATIDLQNVVDKSSADKDVTLNNLSGSYADLTLTLIGDDAEGASMTLSNDSTTSVLGEVIAQDLTLNVESLTKEYTLDDGEIITSTGSLTLAELTLENTDLTVADQANFTVNALSMDADSTLAGTVNLSNGSSTLKGSYNDATVNLGAGATVSINANTASGLTLTGSAGTATLSGASGSTLAAINTTGASVDLGTISDTFTLTGASSMTGGSLTLDVSAALLGNTSVSLIEVANAGEKLTLTNTVLTLAFDGTLDASKLTASASGQYTLFSVGEDVVMGTGSSFDLDSALGLYFSNASLVDGLLVAYRNDSRYEDMAVTGNGSAGLNLISKNMLTVEVAETPTGDYGNIITDMEAYKAAGNKAAADKLAAAVAGATTTSLGSAMMADVERQLRTTRNRTRSMGVDPAQVNHDMPYYNAWITAEGSSSDFSSDSTNAGHKLTNTGGAFGVEADLTTNWSVGASFTALMGDLSSDGADTAEGDFDTMYASVYARMNKGRWNHSIVATYGMLDATLDRTVATTSGAYTTKGDTSGNAFGLMYEVGYTFAVTEDASTCIQPVFSMALVNSSINGYTEKDSSNAALIVGDQKNTFMTFGLGGVLETIVGENIYNRSSVFSARMMVKADAGERTSEADVTLVSNQGVTETVKGADVGNIGLEIGLGITIPVTENVGALFVDASCDLRSGMTSFSGTIGYRFSF